MKINRIYVANAINNLQDPFTCYHILEELGMEKNGKNQEKVSEILHQFVKRKWITNSNGTLFFRSFEEFRF